LGLGFFFLQKKKKKPTRGKARATNLAVYYGSCVMSLALINMRLRLH
jgi:hypothetical protein